MEAKLFEFNITDFEEVYVVIDDKKQRLHLSPVNYSFNITLDLNKNLSVQLDQQTKYGERNFNKRVHQMTEKVFKELNLV